MKLPKRKRNRLTQYDYSTPNAYFITICTEKRKNLFWTEVGAAIGRPHDVPLTNIGMIVKQGILDIPEHYPTITVDHFVIMPNHIHLLLQINAYADGRPMAAPTISSIINKTKGFVSKKAGFSVWQKGFYDHIIRSEQDYLDVWNYIEGNPGKWSEDELSIANI
jgi:REP element-mobilizing transposase RayT